MCEFKPTVLGNLPLPSHPLHFQLLLTLDYGYEEDTYATWVSNTKPI